MSLSVVVAVLIILSAVFLYVNERFIKLPGTIGVVILSILVSVLILVFGKTNSGISATIINLAKSINFSNILLNGLLGFLLFAGALHFDYQQLKDLRWPVLVLSTFSVIISAFVFGILLFGIMQLFHFPFPFIYCLIFGALISPTDPIAVGALLKKSKVPASLQIIISGESMFNDGVGIVLFIVFLEIAGHSGIQISFREIINLFVREVIGGILLGVIIGYIGYRLIKSIKTYQTKFLISIALVLVITLLAIQTHVSIPLATVSAGLIVGNGIFSLKHEENRFLNGVWQLLDEILNTIVFVLMGVQLVLMPFLKNYWLAGALSIIIILLARLVSILFPAIIVLHRVKPGNLAILTWSGLRGGVSVAMALSLPDSPYREFILSGCYFIVIFSIIVQGLTLNKVVDKITERRSFSRKRGYVIRQTKQRKTE